MSRYLSLFSGIEAASVAWKPLGWECVGVAEIEPFPCAVLAHHYPDVPNLGSVTDITEEQIAALGPIDLVVGGSPCQDLSVAGKRAGLAGARSGLFHEQLRIFNAARSFCGARWLLWENVPGAFSSHSGRDFALVVGEMAGAEFGVPRNGWQNAGAAVGESGLVEWRTLDAQFVRVESHPRAVPQRRRRVFALLDTGDWANRPPVLLEPESLRGDSAPRRETGEVAPTIPARSLGGGGLGTDFDCDGGVIPAVTGPISANGATSKKHGFGMGQQDWENGFAIPAFASKVAPPLGDCSNGGGGNGPGRTVDTVESLVAHSLRAEGFDASEDSTGRGTPLVPWAFSCKDHGADAGEVAPTLRSMNFDGSHANGGGQVAVAFPIDTRNALRTTDKDTQNRQGVGVGEDGDPSATLTGMFVPAVAQAIGWSEELTAHEGIAGTLQRGGDGGRHEGVMTPSMQVRRLTPRECERLQGFPDDYTQIPFRNKPAADGPRYKALGNSMAVNVMRWIGARIQEAASA